MDSFSSKDFYGHSLSNDPKLRTTTTNYEFKFNSSCHLDKVIDRVKIDRERKRQNDFLAHACMMSSIQQPPYVRGGQSVAVFPAPNVETHIGRSKSREAVVRIMSDEEIEAMISQALATRGYAPSTSVVAQSDNFLKGERPFVEQPKKESKTAIQTLEYAPALQPQWVEIKPTAKAKACIIFAPYTELEAARRFEEDLRSYAFPDDLSIHNLVIRDSDIDAPTPRIEAESPLASPLSNGIESNLDEAERAELMRAFGVLPEVPDMDLQILDSEDETESSELYQASEDEESPVDVCANRVQPVVYIRQLECPRPSRTPEESQIELHELQSPLPLEHTERSLEMEPLSPARRDETETPQDNEQIIRIESSPSLSDQRFQPTTPDDTPKMPKETARSHENGKQSILSARQGSCQSPQKQRSSTKPSKRNQLALHEMSSDSQQMPARISKMSSRQRKELEAVKYEKIRIFSKMTSIQEEIIEGLDKLRMSLLDMSLPDGHVERKLRERNAMEFSVRFSRNYLFPLGRWIEEIQASPKEEYQSCLTNEPCDKVCGVYGLLNQALQCYHKQLRHLYNENVPKKLDILLRMIIDTTEICLRKKIFDKRDTLIQCLLTRSASFLEFITKMSEERRSARQERDSVRSARRDQLLKTSSKWDLTMSLNNLNMYQPKLVAKKPKKKPQTKVTPMSSSRAPPRSGKIATRVRVDRDTVASPVPDPVDTEVAKLGNAESMQLLTAAIEEHPDSELTRTVIETLQDITKDEVRQMLNPILSNLDTILKNSDNPQNVESVLGALNSELLAQCKQQKIDAAATENSTQNSNTYQKEVTKKGAKSDKSKQRKENRLKTSFSNNLKTGSTEQTERSNSRDRCTDTKRDKQSPSNVDEDDDDNVADDVVVEKTSHTSRSRSLAGGRGAFLSPKTAAAAKKPTPAPAAATRTGGKPKTLPSSSSRAVSARSRVQSDEVMPSQTQLKRVTKSKQKMTSRGWQHSSSLPVVVDTLAPTECQHEAVGANRKVIASQRKVNDDGAANAEDNEEACQGHPPAAKSSGEMNCLNYSNNAQYTFVTYSEDALPSTSNFHENSEGVCPSESCIKFAAKASTSDSFKSANSGESILPPPEPISDSDRLKKINEEHVNRLIENRNKFIEKCQEDPLYSNPMFPKPWKVLSKISLSLTEDIFGEFESEVSFGEESYVTDFINAEMQN